MKKIISSTIILLILLLILWVLSAWTLGKQVQQNFRTFFEDNSVNSSDVFDFRLLSFSSSVFGATAQVSVDINEQNSIVNSIANIMANSTDGLFMNIDIQNGPILINKSGIKLGYSFWKVTLNKNLNENLENSKINKNQIKQLFTLFISRDFENIINYAIPLKLSFSELLIEGKYDLNSSINVGSIKAKKVDYLSKKYQLNTNEIELKFKHFIEQKNDTNINNNLSLSGMISDLNFLHKNMSETLKLQLKYDGNSTVKKGILNSQNTIRLNTAINSIYPIKNAEFKFQISDLLLTNLVDLQKEISQISNLNKQKQWILEEQGELPEGQDQIWQLQDQIDKRYATLAEFITKALVSSDGVNTKTNSVFNFSLINHYKGSQSQLYGELKPMTELLPFDDISNISLFSITQLKANVALDNAMYEFISSK